MRTTNFTWDTFQEWLVNNKKLKENTAGSINSRINRIKEEYTIEYEYIKDGCAELLSDFTYTTEDAKNGIIPNVRINISGSYLKGLRSLKRALILYVEYLDTYTPSTPAPTATACAFKGSFDDFKNFTGPKWRNKIQAITKIPKKQVTFCECCGKKKTLEAAHRNGFERNDLIKKILDDNFLISPDNYEVDLYDFEQKFIDAHKPLADVFFFLCADCHDEYDGKDVTKSNLVEKTVLANRKKKTTP